MDTPTKGKLLVVLLLMMAWPEQAFAQGRIIIGQQETISRLGSIADQKVAMGFGEELKVSEGFVEAAERARHGGLLASVGFRYKEVMLGMPVWTREGAYCVFLGRRYFEVTAGTAAQLLGVREADLQPPFLYRVPLGLIAYPLVVVIGIPIALFLKRRDDEAKRRAHQTYLDSFQTSEAAIGSEHVASVLLRPTSSLGSEVDRIN